MNKSKYFNLIYSLNILIFMDKSDKCFPFCFFTNCFRSTEEATVNIVEENKATSTVSIVEENKATSTVSTVEENKATSTVSTVEENKATSTVSTAGENTINEISPNLEKAISTFDDMRLKEDLLRGIYAYGFEKPSAIQQPV